MGIFNFGKKKQMQSNQSENAIKTCECGSGCECRSGCDCNAGEKTVKVLGGGCAKCNQLEESAKSALAELGMNVEIERVRDFAEIAKYGVMSTPALVINEKVVSFGKVLKTQEVVEILQNIINK